MLLIFKVFKMKSVLSKLVFIMYLLYFHILF